jgi:hypothetical protein
MSPEEIRSPVVYPATSSWHCLRTLSWGAVLAGVAAALALHVVFVLLGAGVGFAIYNPLRDEKPVADLASGALIIQGVSAVFSLWFGGWVAGRFTQRHGSKLGALHGLLVWCVATVAGILALSTGAGWAVGDLSKVVGGGLSLAGKPAAAAVGQAGDLAKASAKRSTTTLGSFIDEGVAGRPTTSSPAGAIKAKREIGLAVARLFAPGQESNQEQNRAAVVQSLVDSGVSQADANQMVSEWTKSYAQLKEDIRAAKEDAEQRARVAGEEAAHTLSVLAFCSFFALVIGAIAATSGGKHGGICAWKQAERAEPLV